ncbi:hypothetical protein LUX39_41770 [Actinomadura madurae]|nr:hypothetical protein [Actinomadura madurae]MCQ0019501.1 hypothetical protein [Actinomadura madurae]
MISSRGTGPCPSRSSQCRARPARPIASTTRSARISLGGAAGRPRHHLDAGDAARRRGEQPDDVAPLGDPDAGQRLDPLADDALQQRPARLDRPLRAGAPGEDVPAEGEAVVDAGVGDDGAAADELRLDAGQEVLQDPLPARQQDVGVPALRDSPAAGSRRALVAFHQRDPFVGPGQDAGREQPRHSGPEHHRVFSDASHLVPPVVR